MYLARERKEKGGEGRFIYNFQCRKIEKNSISNICLFSQFFLIIICAKNLIYAILYVHIYISQDVKKN